MSANPHSKVLSAPDSALLAADPSSLGKMVTGGQRSLSTCKASETIGWGKPSYPLVAPDWGVRLGEGRHMCHRGQNGDGEGAGSRNLSVRGQRQGRKVRKDWLGVVDPPGACGILC